MEAKESKEWPRNGDMYWYVTSSGYINANRWSSHIEDTHRKECGIFSTKEEAQAEKMRRESMAQRGKMPEEGSKFWYWDFVNNKPDTSTALFYPFYYSDYWIGSVKKTKEECAEWGRKYAKYFER